MTRRRGGNKEVVSLPRTLSSSSVEEELPRPPPNVRKSLPCASVVKIFTVASRPNFRQPWQMSQLEHFNGSGFVIQNKHILTNAHVVCDHTTVRVRRHGGHHKFVAKVLCINHACDLALLTVEDSAFWTDLPELEVADEVPQLDERVLVIGYPMGGDTISVTRGVVSRVTTLSYADQKLPQLSSGSLLVVQIDAAINSGNSGGPVFRENGKVIGVAFSGYAGSADNIGYIIPYPVIKNFLEDFARLGVSDGVCDLGFTYEVCENEAMQRMLKLTGDYSGVHVIRVKPLSASNKIIKDGDVVTSINGFKVANDGTIAFRNEERVHLTHAITSHPFGKPLTVELLRAGKPITVELKGMRTPFLVAPYRKDKEMPSYFIVGGAVFTVLTGGLLETAVDEFDDDAWEFSRHPKRFPDEEVVVRISWLSHPINHGYASHRAERIVKCNGVKIRNIKHLKAVVERSKEFVHFITGVRRSIIFDVEEAKKMESEILETYAIPSPCSRDLVDVDSSYEPMKWDLEKETGNKEDDDEGAPYVGSPDDDGEGGIFVMRQGAPSAKAEKDQETDDDDDNDEDGDGHPTKRAKKDKRKPHRHHRSTRAASRKKAEAQTDDL
eukprot:m.58869 g.58869  ORF g.58869 m.58869 type:complete len:609 (-) comp13185_c0_seq1:171-1997(-)